MLGGKQVGQGRIDSRAARVGEPNEHSAPILGVIFPFDQSARSQPVDPIGHGAGGDQCLPG